MALGNTLPSKGTRQEFQFSVDEDGVEVSSENSDRAVLVIMNLGPDTAWGGKTLESATPEAGFPIYAGDGIIDSDSMDAWCLKTEAGNSADIRGWEVRKP